MSRSIDDLQPIFRARVVEWLDDCKIAGINILLTCTLRDAATQAALYEIGRTVVGAKPTAKRPMGLTVTNAKPGQSAHQYGFALDYVPLVLGKPDWSGTSDVWNQSIALAQARGMESLRPMESAHLQLPDWKSHV